MFKSIKISIPKSFISKDRKFRVELKHELIGYTETDSESKLFYGTLPVFSIDIESVNHMDIVREIKEKIVNVYIKHIIEKQELTKDELILFYHIKNIESKYINEESKNNTLVLSYDSDSFCIKNIILGFDTKCDCFEIPKNIELYLNEGYKDIYSTVTNKINRNKYNKFILDITNLYIPGDYSNTKKIIDFIESKNGRILFLVNKPDYSIDRFVTIFGKKYKNNVVDKEKYLHPQYSLVLYKIKSILFD